jgi:hypothetical protein
VSGPSDQDGVVPEDRKVIFIFALAETIILRSKPIKSAAPQSAKSQALAKAD